MKIKIISILLISIIMNAQGLYNKNLYGFNGKVKTVISYLYENQNFTKELDEDKYVTKTTLHFLESGILLESIRDVKYLNDIYTYKSTYSNIEDEVLQVKFDYENKVSDSVSYKKVNKNIWSIYSKQISTKKFTTGEQIINDLGRDLSASYTDYDNSVKTMFFSYENTLKDNLIIKTSSNNNNNAIVTEYYEYSYFDNNQNAQKIIIFASDRIKINKIIIRKFIYY